MLSLRIELLTGRYVASEYNNRDRAEWPPHPARVFSALVAAYYESGKPGGGERALRWLESLPPPQLSFSPASPRDVKTHFVPVNDRALSDAATVNNAWAKVLGPGLNDKQRAKAEARLKKAYERAAAEDKKLAKSFKEALDHVMPATRTKQPRTFPSVTPEDPVVHLTWDESPDPELRAGLDAVAAALVRVGHSSSLVAAIWTESSPEPTWVPHDLGDQVLRWVRPGQLNALDALHDAAPYSEQRVMPFAVVRYRSHRPIIPSFTSNFARHFTVLRRVEGPRLPIEAAESVADGVRRALMSHADEPHPSLITGHAAGGGPLQSDHLAIAALPYVEAGYASGDLLGVALIPPAGLDLAELRPLYAAIARWEDATEHSGDQALSVLKLGRLGRWLLERDMDMSPLYNLREATWTRRSSVWASVTPVVLDRHPGSLTSDRRRTVARANTTIAAACRRIGLPEPAQIELGYAPFFKGSSDSRKFRRRRGTNDRRPLLHVRLRFNELVGGPVLLGAGRYRGLGLLRPLGGQDA